MIIRHKISLKKTVMIHQETWGSKSEITADGGELDSVDKLYCLGSKLTKNLDLNNKITKHIVKVALNPLLRYSNKCKCCVNF